MSKIYVVRELAFMYNDESYYAGKAGGIIGQYTDIEEARAEINKRNIEYFKMFPTREYDEFWHSDQGNMQALRAYLATVLDEEVMNYYEEWDVYRLKEDINLPRLLTDEQLLKVMEIMKINYYTLLEFDDADPVFYIMWLPRSGHPLQLEIDYSYRGEGKVFSPIFYETREKLFNAIEEYGYLFHRIPFEDTFENLSDTPELLESFVQDKQSFKVADGKLGLDYDPVSEEIVGLNALLKEPLFEVRTIMLDEAAAIPHDPFAMP